MRGVTGIGVVRYRGIGLSSSCSTEAAEPPAEEASGLCGDEDVPTPKLPGLWHPVNSALAGCNMQSP